MTLIYFVEPLIFYSRIDLHINQNPASENLSLRTSDRYRHYLVFIMTCPGAHLYRLDLDNLTLFRYIPNYCQIRVSQKIETSSGKVLSQPISQAGETLRGFLSDPVVCYSKPLLRSGSVQTEEVLGLESQVYRGIAACENPE